MAFVITEDQTFVAAISPRSRSGQLAQIDGIPVWTCDNPILTIAPAADGLSCLISPSDTGIGSAQIVVSADADLGAGVKNITGVLDVQLMAGSAVTLAIDAGAPVNR